MSKDVAVRRTVELDAVAGLLAEHRRCLDSIKEWEERRDQLAEKIQLLLGEAAAGTINGREVVTWERIDRFQGARFKKEHPDLYKVYTDTVEVEQFNVKALAQARPDIYEEYQVRQLRNGYVD